MIPDSTFWPEGVDYDPRTGRDYVASVRHRTIAEVSADGAVRELWPRDRAGIGAMLGVRADEPTIGTLAGGSFVYVANSQWEEYDDAGRLKPGARLTRPRLVAVPLPRAPR